MIGENLLGPDPTLLAEEIEAEAAHELAHAAASERANSASATSESATEEIEGVVKRHPDSPLAWAVLAREAADSGRTIEAYAFARVGYHRGLDALRKSGWRGQGPVPWSHEPNRGVLRALYELREAARSIGETSEVERLTEFLQGADPRAAHEIENLLARQ